MPQRKSPPSASKKPGGPAKASSPKSSPAAKPAAAKSGPAKPGSAKTSAASKAAAAKALRQPPVKKKPGKSIVNQKQTPWALIVTTVLIVIFAAGIVTYAIANHKSKPAANGGCSKMIGNNSTSYLNELQCAKDIQGVTFKQEPNRNHQDGVLKYDATPPVGGNHSPYWADCTGTVYPAAIANENAVHMLEHGAVWITYRPNLSPADVAKLSALVSGNDRLAMSPYPDLDSPISLQSWGYQLKVNSATDPRIQKFITALKYNPKTTPEYGATCSQPTFKAHPSTFGKPLDAPAS
jgi:Protein of unknown function (DUF3105)